LVAFYAEHPFLVDTNCLAITRHTLTGVADLWFNGYHADAILSTELVRTRVGSSTGTRTVNYRLHEHNEEMMTRYFRDGNDAMQRRYGQGFPWRNARRCAPIIAPGVGT
jgi:hypothetical protein